MKHIKKLFALAIIAAVCAAFTMGLIACNNDDNKPSVVMIAYDSEIMDGSITARASGILNGTLTKQEDGSVTFEGREIASAAENLSEMYVILQGAGGAGQQ